jgi:opacity protein-like surface antigen
MLLSGRPNRELSINTDININPYMIKRIIIYTFAIIICFSGLLSAEDYIGIGAHIGFHHDVGNLESQNSDIEIDPQNNYFLGFSFKTNFSFLFARFGADTTFLINRGEVLENSGSGTITYAKIHYLSMPLFIGLNYKILNLGNFYMGPGASYFVARGNITSSTGASEDISTTGWGYGFMAGIEYRLSNKIDFYFEWEYLDGKSEPAIQNDPLYKEDFYVDFTGHRFILGIRYYLI